MNNETMNNEAMNNETMKNEHKEARRLTWVRQVLGRDEK